MTYKVGTRPPPPFFWRKISPPLTIIWGILLRIRENFLGYFRKNILPFPLGTGPFTLILLPRCPAYFAESRTDQNTCMTKRVVQQIRFCQTTLALLFPMRFRHAKGNRHAAMKPGRKENARVHPVESAADMYRSDAWLKSHHKLYNSFSAD
ncbi:MULTISPECIES: hypothetical protein [Brevibacillus]|uniref:hypothetical protein n=1 Tax=Brevibacillus TaxID=55080 RepID=UPI00238065DD|nr:MULTISPECIES: hypothetical protein [Brevibacillus]MDH6351991.1 hypothetical protein [Brevibacillus sp. 1238]WDV95997.1 hypothetical protein PSE45_03310 [Brevibacillus parabrevis]